MMMTIPLLPLWHLSVREARLCEQESALLRFNLATESISSYLSQAEVVQTDPNG